MTKVINIKDAPKGWETDPDYVYIGRPSVWGNPFPLKGEIDRAACLAKYLNWYQKTQPYPTLDALWNKTLVCYCAPKLCHGNVLALIADLEWGW